MAQTALHIGSLSDQAQDFLYGCAFRIVADDEAARPAEQQWLAAEFGARRAAQWLDEYAALDDRQYLSRWTHAFAAMDGSERLLVLSSLESWLLRCCTADGDAAAGETAAVADVLRRAEELRAQTDPPTGTPRDDAGPSDRTHGGAARAPLPAGEPPVRWLQGHTREVTAVAFLGDGPSLASGSDDGTVRVWDTTSGNALLSWSADSLGVTAIAAPPPGRWLLSAGRFGRATIWDTETGAALWQTPRRAAGGALGADATADGALIAVAGIGGPIEVWDRNGDAPARILGDRASGPAHALRFSPDGQRLLSGGEDGRIRLWDPAAGGELALLSGHTDAVLDVRWSPDAARAVSSGRDNTVRVWDVSRATQVAVLSGHTFNAASACFAHDASRVLSGGWDHTLKLWDAARGTVLLNLDATGLRFNSVAFRPRTGEAAAGCSDGSVCLLALPAR
jgi:WD40 repeat protein